MLILVNTSNLRTFIDPSLPCESLLPPINFPFKCFQLLFLPLCCYKLFHCHYIFFRLNGLLIQYLNLKYNYVSNFYLQFDFLFNGFLPTVEINQCALSHWLKCLIFLLIRFALIKLVKIHHASFASFYLDYRPVGPSTCPTIDLSDYRPETH